MHLLSEKSIYYKTNLMMLVLSLSIILIFGSVSAVIFSIGNQTYIEEEEYSAFINISSDDYTIRKVLYSMLISTLLALTLVYFISRKLYRMISIPISSLANTLTSVAITKDFSARSKKYYNDEIGLLVEAFNFMLNQIQERDKEIIESRKEAEKASNLKSDFLSNMSHELRTPVHGILGFTLISKSRLDDWDKDKQSENLDNISSAGNRLLDLLNNLLDLSKLESRTVEYNFSENNIMKVGSSMIEHLKALISEKELIIDMNDNSSNETLTFDYDKISQVITNLLSNAIKFSYEGGKISINIDDAEIESEYEGGFLNIPAVMFSINDSGIGIPENELKTVFDKFIQSSKTNSGAGGTGLGLAICREIIEGHDGKIWAESKDGEGTNIKFIIPIEHIDHEDAEIDKTYFVNY